MPNMKQMYEDTNKTIEAYPRVWLPVGTIYYNRYDISDEIAQYFVGTWERCLQGEVLVGVNESDDDFKTSWGTFGTKTHTLTVTEMPSHAHSLSSPNGTLYADINSSTYITMAASGSTWITNRGQISMGNNGGSQAHNNVQPSRMAYAWIRVS